VGEAEARHQNEQVEVGQAERPTPVEQAEEEDRAEGQPDVGRVDHPAEGARVAARHSPGDLVARPRLADLAARRVDYHLDDLLAAGEEPDLPEPGGIVAAGRRAEIGVLARSRLRLRISLRDLDRSGLGDPRGRRGRCRGLLPLRGLSRRRSRRQQGDE
jgi:hypothetical protein